MIQRLGSRRGRRGMMKNDECTIYITTKHGYTQTYRRGKSGWTQVGPNGIVRQMTAEQLLSHILPVLVTGHLNIRNIRVEPDKEIDEEEK